VGLNKYATSRPTVDAAEEILGKYFPVHDFGFVALKDYCGSDQCIEAAARISYSYGTRQKGDTRSLIRSLVRRSHTSPSEMVIMKFHMAMPIFVARQIIRVRTARVNELSGRYSLMPMLFYRPTPEQVQAQSKKDKQGRSDALPDEVVSSFLEGLETKYDVSESGYKWATENDIARELARIDLPLSTYTSWIWQIDGNNLFKTLSLRCDAHAQWETRQYFNIIAGMAKRLMPYAFEAWEDYRFYAKTFSKQEMEALRCLLRDSDNPYPDSVLDANGLTKTEKVEFYDKCTKPEQINFDLDLSTAKEPEYFEELYRNSAK
jgi:thymidylate synthase (FAD)